MQNPFPENPYTSPPEEPAVTSLSLDGMDMERLLQIRSTYERTENAVRQLAGMCFFFGVFSVILVFMMSAVSIAPGEKMFFWVRDILCVVLALLVPVFFVLTFFLSRRTPTARMWATGMSVLLLAAFPIGTVYGLYALWLLRGKQAEVVFSPEFQKILRVTEEDAMRRSLVGRAVIAVGVCMLVYVFMTYAGPMLLERYRQAVMPKGNAVEEMRKINRPVGP